MFFFFINKSIILAVFIYSSHFVTGCVCASCFDVTDGIGADGIDVTSVVFVGVVDVTDDGGIDVTDDGGTNSIAFTFNLDFTNGCVGANGCFDDSGIDVTDGACVGFMMSYIWSTISFFFSL